MHFFIFLISQFPFSLTLCFFSLSFFLLFKFSLNFFFSFFLKFFKFSLLLLVLSFLISQNDLLAYILAKMRVFVHQFNIVATFLAFFSFTSTKLKMSISVKHFDLFIAKFTWLWLHCALTIMVSIFELDSLKLAMFTSYFYVFFFLVLFLVSLGHTLPTLFAFVVLARASYVMHPKF